MVSVNLSPAQFHRGDVLQTVAQALEVSGLAANRLQLELTEDVFVGTSEPVLRILRTLKAKGVAIAVDDFGTGHSSLGSIQKFTFDMIKIDRSFVHNMGFDRTASAIIQAVLDLGRRLGVQVVAEGVEMELQLQRLLMLSCERAQGHLLGRPIVSPQLSVVSCQTEGHWPNLANLTRLESM